MTKITKGAISVFDQVTSAMGLKGSVFEHKLREETDANPEPEETSNLPEESTTASGVPTSFSWRTEYPECLGPIEDQGECGACWAFSSGGLLADRFCIHSKGAITTRLSPQEMVNCNYENYGCVGGYLMTTIDYLMTEGAVPKDCIPY